MTLHSFYKCFLKKKNPRHTDHPEKGKGFLSISSLGCMGSLIIPERLTSSILDCRQGKENVNPTGNFLSLIFFFLHEVSQALSDVIKKLEEAQESSWEGERGLSISGKM